MEMSVGWRDPRGGSYLRRQNREGLSLDLENEEVDFSLGLDKGMLWAWVGSLCTEGFPL